MSSKDLELGVVAYVCNLQDLESEAVDLCEIKARPNYRESFRPA